MKHMLLLQGIVDRHTSRKNALTCGTGPVCDCEDCDGIRKVIRELEKSGCSRLPRTEETAGSNPAFPTK
jgi:hypothetical protein